MNYYEQHIGDYAKDAGHLSLIEDGAYRRLLDAYYTREEPLPGDLKACCKLARATTKPEREVVTYVVREFFELREDGYHQKRCDAEIERFKAKQEKARRSANARWNPDVSDSERNAGAMRTHSEGNAPRARPQSPVTSHQTPEDQKQASPSSTAAPSTDLLRQAAERPADLKAHRALRLSQVTDDAIETFNASALVKPNGGMLATVSPRVGREKRQQQVARCLRTAKAICQESYDSQTITREFLEDYWAACAADEHKSGRRGGGKDHPDWLPTFEYLTREKTMLEVYDRVNSEVAA